MRQEVRAGFGRIGAGAVTVLVGVVLLSGTAGASPSAAAQLFRNCDEARAAGFSDMRAGEPGYSTDLDADSDGVACDSETAAPAAPAVPDPAPQPAPQAAMPEVQGATQDSLAQTGVSFLTPLLLGAALVLVFMGRRLVDAGYQRLDWIPGRRRAEVRYTVEPVRRRR
jgi:hypothetical protein